MSHLHLPYKRVSMLIFNLLEIVTTISEIKLDYVVQDIENIK